jgi:hypothetical protein
MALPLYALRHLGPKRATSKSIHATFAESSHTEAGSRLRKPVLYARSQLFPRRELAPASALILHLDDNLIRIKHLGHSRHLVEGQRYFSESVLVRCVLVIAKKHGCDRAEWEFRNKALAKACCDDHDFVLVKRAGTRYKGLRKNKFLVEKMLIED